MMIFGYISFEKYDKHIALFVCQKLGIKGGKIYGRKTGFNELD